MMENRTWVHQPPWLELRYFKVVKVVKVVRSEECDEKVRSGEYEAEMNSESERNEKIAFVGVWVAYRIWAQGEQRCRFRER